MGGDRGSTSTEYGMLVAFIAITIAFGIGAFGTTLLEWFEALGRGVIDALT